MGKPFKKKALRKCFGCGKFRVVPRNETRCKDCIRSRISESNHCDGRVKKGPFVGWRWEDVPKCVKKNQPRRSIYPLDYMQRSYVLKALGFNDYHEYLRSDTWRAIRRRVLPSKCYMECGARASEVHHKFYSEANLTGESIDGLYPLCAKCHERVEFANGEKRNLQKAGRKFTSIHRANTGFYCGKQEAF